MPDGQTLHRLPAAPPGRGAEEPDGECAQGEERDAVGALPVLPALFVRDRVEVAARRRPPVRAEPRRLLRGKLDVSLVPVVNRRHQRHDKCGQSGGDRESNKHGRRIWSYRPPAPITRSRDSAGPIHSSGRTYRPIKGARTSSVDRAAAIHVEPSHGPAAANTTAAAHPLLTNRLRAVHLGVNRARNTLHTALVSHLRTIGLPLRLAPVAAVLVLLAVAAPAGAAPSCGRQVIDDWFADSRVDRTYPLHCYDDAIGLLQPDVRDYSNAEEEITRALQRRGRTPSPPPATTDPPPDDGPGAGAGPGEKPPKPPKKPTTTVVDHPETENPPVVAPPLDGASASSVPIPLLVLSGLALLLIASGSAGYFVRRSQGRNTPPRNVRLSRGCACPGRDPKGHRRGNERCSSSPRAPTCARIAGQRPEIVRSFRAQPEIPAEHRHQLHRHAIRLRLVGDAVGVQRLVDHSAQRPGSAGVWLLGRDQALQVGADPRCQMQPARLAAKPESQQLRVAPLGLSPLGGQNGEPVRAVPAGKRELARIAELLHRAVDELGERRVLDRPACR